MTCAVCGQPIKVVVDGYMREVVGWLNPTLGGGGQIIRRRDTGRVAHKVCIKGSTTGRLL